MIFQNFITVLKRYTSSSILNIAGLGIAFASAYLILVQVCFDLSYNRNIGNAENIYRLEYPSWYREGFYSAPAASGDGRIRSRDRGHSRCLYGGVGPRRVDQAQCHHRQHVA